VVAQRLGAKQDFQNCHKRNSPHPNPVLYKRRTVNPAEALVVALIVLAPGGFWLGYTFLKDDAKVKLAQYGKGVDPDAAGDVERLKREVADLKRQLEELRETSTSFDLSLEEHLKRLESKLTPDETLRDRIQN